MKTQIIGTVVGMVLFMVAWTNSNQSGLTAGEAYTRDAQKLIDEGVYVKDRRGICYIVMHPYKAYGMMTVVPCDKIVTGGNSNEQK
jgi:hypothetical protein